MYDFDSTAHIDEAVLDKALSQTYGWYVDFLNSDEFKPLLPEHAECAEFVIMFLTEVMYTYFGLTPEHWTVPKQQEVLVNVLPAKVADDPVLFESAVPVLNAFYRYLINQNLLPQAQALQNGLTGLQEKIVANAANPEVWGFSKAFSMAAIQAGVDLNDEGQMQTFTDYYNGELMRLFSDANANELLALLQQNTPSEQNVDTFLRINRDEYTLFDEIMLEPKDLPNNP